MAKVNQYQLLLNGKKLTKGDVLWCIFALLDELTRAEIPHTFYHWNNLLYINGKKIGRIYAKHKIPFEIKDLGFKLELYKGGK